jgi:hypothetical protein
MTLPIYSVNGVETIGPLNAPRHERRERWEGHST